MAGQPLFFEIFFHLPLSFEDSNYTYVGFLELLHSSLDPLFILKILFSVFYFGSFYCCVFEFVNVNISLC